MNRPIKFRVWDGVDYMSTPFTIQDVQTRKIEFTPDCPVMQFTGLTDRNGVEIYEGDVVRFKEYNRLYQVLYKEASFRLIHLSNDSLNGLEWGRLDRMFELIEPPTIEVIGNIYQNPELLKGGSPA